MQNGKLYIFGMGFMCVHTHRYTQNASVEISVEGVVSEEWVGELKDGVWSESGCRMTGCEFKY